MNKKYSKELERIAKKWEKTLKNRRKECGKNHKNINWDPYIVTDLSDYLDKVKGVCTYCLIYLKRPLNKEELSEIEKFRENLRENYNR